jgi:hypothetical protein
VEEGELTHPIQELARKLAAAYAALAQVKAVALAGSRAGPFEPDAGSDVDLYVYREGEIPVPARLVVASENSTQIEIGNAFWEEGDEWVAQEPPVKVDVMLRDVRWIEDEIERVLDRHEARLGYSTCFLHNVQTCIVLYDREGWLSDLNARVSQDYPSALRDAIVAKNHPVLRNAHSAYSRQIAAAARRNDFVSINHRVAALLASYFDIVIAVNRVAHPGEKRLVQFVQERCASRPEGLGDDVASLLAAIPRGGGEIVGRVAALLDALDDWLLRLGLLPAWPRPRERL